MKKVFLYYFRSRIPAILILMVALSIMTIIIQAQSSFISYSQTQEVSHRTEIHGQTNPFIYLSVLACVIVSVIPILEFSFKMKRRSLDLYYSIPLKRIKFYIVKYCVGLAEFAILFIPQWLLSFIWLATTPSVTTVYDMSYYLYYLLAAIGFRIMVFSFETFFFTMGNALVDGIILMVLPSCFLPTLMNVMYSLILKADTSDRTLYMRWFFMYSPFFDLSVNFYSKMESTTLSSINVLGLVLNLALAISFSSWNAIPFISYVPYFSSKLPKRIMPSFAVVMYGNTKVTKSSSPIPPGIYSSSSFSFFFGITKGSAPNTLAFEVIV
jgi:hypothetical protein